MGMVFKVRPKQIVQQYPAKRITQVPYTQESQQLQMENIWADIFLNNQHLLQRFLAQGNWYKNILHSRQLSPGQKFEYIFGIRLSDLYRRNLLGDVFEWLNNLFSNQNLSQAENWLRQGQSVAQRIAMGLNVMRNSPTPEEQALMDQESQDFQSRLFTRGYSIGQSFWPLIVAGLVFILILKK